MLSENKFDPPRVYLVLLSSLVYYQPTEAQIRENILIKENDTVAANDLIYKDKSYKDIFNLGGVAYSPVRGVVEKINYDTGTIIIREIQDYPLYPVEVDIAKKLKVKEKDIKGYMKKREGEFVYADEILATNFKESLYNNIKSPYSGNITEINTKTGCIKICYLKKPHQIFAQCFGEVVNIIENEQIDIAVNCFVLDGKIGFGKDRGGYLKTYNTTSIDYDNSVIYIPHVSTPAELQALAGQNINGLIVNTMSYAALKGFLSKDIGVALTGNEELPFSIIILSGFSENETFNHSEKFMEYEGKYALLKPYTQIRAGATRPRVLIHNLDL